MEHDNEYFALKAAELGLAVFPCHNCPGNPELHKKPLVKWRDESTIDPERIEAMWKRWPTALPAIDLAKAGLFVLDGDRHANGNGVVEHDGVAALKVLFAEHVIEPGTVPAVLSPGDGRHYYFRQPEGDLLGNSEGELKGQGINVRGAGGYVIAPGAQLPDGRRYAWDKHTPNLFTALREGTVPTLPDCLVKLLRNGHRNDEPTFETAIKTNETVKNKFNGSSVREQAYAAAALEGCARELAGTASGGRNNRLNELAFRLGTMIARGWLSRGDVERDLYAAAEACGLVKDDTARAVRATIRSGLDAGEKQPHPDLQDREFSSGEIHHSKKDDQIKKDDEKGERQSPPLPWIDMSRWDDEPPPPRQWAIRNRVPLRQAGLFSGEGGTGKSIIELTKNVAHVTGKDWFGSMPEIGGAFYVGAEDEEDEIHRRFEAIAKHYGTTFAELIRGGLKALCLLGQDATLCATTGKSGKVETTALYKSLYEQAGDLKPKNISIDTLSRAFAGSEIERVQVYGFASHMQALAMAANSSVTVLSHPSLSGIASGSGISGSTAWHGAFRFRQYLEGVRPEGGDRADDDMRELEFKKNQYGPRGETMVLKYDRDKHLFLPVPGVSSLNRAAKEARADDVFVTLLLRFARENRNVSDKIGTNYAPAMFSREAEAKESNLTSLMLADAMRRLFKAGRIWNEPCGKPSRPSSRIALKR